MGEVFRIGMERRSRGERRNSKEGGRGRRGRDLGWTFNRGVVAGVVRGDGGGESVDERMKAGAIIWQEGQST